MMHSANPKIIHRIYFTNFSPYYDPYEHFLESWHRHMPDYEIMLWGKDNLDVSENEWTRLAARDNQPVFLSEYFRWKLLAEYGGLYLDADCEIVDGPVLHRILEDLHAQDSYDVLFGVEERANGHPTAQTFAAKKDAELVRYMCDMYQNRLAPLWPWRESRNLLGPQLIASYFLNKGMNIPSGGHFTDLEDPVVMGRAKIYPQRYFSPKFSILGGELEYEQGMTCVYHMFANENIDFSKDKRLSEARTKALTFDDYRRDLEKSLQFPRVYGAESFFLDQSALVGGKITSTGDGLASFGPYVRLSANKYRVVWYLNQIPAHGTIILKITSNRGNKHLASKTYDLNTLPGKILGMSFEITEKVEKDVEFCFYVFGGQPIQLERIIVNIDHSKPILPSKRKSLRILHRVYFGFDGQPDQFKTYLESWKKHLPDFTIMYWDATNLPMEINEYVRQLHKEKDHAFLTDFFRWYLLREYGGTYLDADVEVVDGKIYRSLIDNLEKSTEYDAFIGIDEKGGGWYTAHSMASKPGSDLSNFMCDLYENFGGFAGWRKRGFYFWAPQLVALYFNNRGHNIEGMGTTPQLEQPVVKAGVKIYPQDWFSPLAPTGNKDEPFILNGLSSNTCLCHHFACSWHDADSFYASYSKSKGGQANVLLKSLASTPFHKIFDYRSGALSSVIGISHGGFMITSGTAGLLSYGPHISLPKGSYLAIFEIHELFSLTGITLEISAAEGTLLATIPLKSSDIVDGAIKCRFGVPYYCTNIDIKISVELDSVIAIRHLTIKSAR